MFIIKLIARRIANMQYWEMAVYIGIVGLIIILSSVGDCQKVIMGPKSIQSISEDVVNSGDIAEGEVSESSNCFYQGRSGNYIKILTGRGDRYYYAVVLDSGDQMIVDMDKSHKKMLDNLANAKVSVKLQGKIKNLPSDVVSMYHVNSLNNYWSGDIPSGELTKYMLEYKSYVRMFGVNILGLLIVIGAIATFFIRKGLKEKSDAEYERIKNINPDAVNIGSKSKIAVDSMEEEFERIINGK